MTATLKLRGYPTTHLLNLNMTESIEKKSKEKRGDLGVDLDAMLDEAEFSLAPGNDSPDDDDAIDRLLMNAGFDSDNTLMQTGMGKGNHSDQDDEQHDELDDFLSFDGFDDDFNESKMGRQDSPRMATVKIEGSEQANLSGGPQDDDLDRLLMNAGFDIDNATAQSNQAEDLSTHVKPESATGTAPVVTDEIDEFFGFGDDFDESDLIQEDEASAAANLIAPAEEPQAAIEQSFDDENVVDGLGLDAGFDDATAQSTEEENVSTSAEPEQAAVVADEVEESFDFGDDFDGSELIEDDQLQASAMADLIAPNEERQAIVESPLNDTDAVDSLLADTEDALTQTNDKTDEIDDFSGFDDDFNEADLIQDDETAASASADLTAANEQRQAIVESALDGTDAVDSLLVDAEEALTQASDKTGEIDDFSGFGDDFNESDLIQDDEAETAGEEDEGSINDLPDDENNIDNLLMDANFGVEDALEKTIENKDEFGDDAGLDDLFQLDKVSDDFSRPSEDAQLAKTDELSDQEDDFLLPDFDITADTEITGDAILPDRNSNVGIDDDLADVFGDTDFLNEDDAVQQTAELQPMDNEAVAEPTPTQISDTAVEDADDVKLSPFGFEQEDIKKQLEDTENKLKKAKLVNYAALGFGVVAVSAAVGLGVMTYSAKTEVTKLTEVVSNLEANLAKSTVNNPNAEINAMKNSVVQLNQQLDGFITELKGNPQFPVDVLNHKVPNIVAKQEMVSKALEMLQVKIGGLEGNAASAAPDAEPSKPKVEHEHPSVKEESAHEVAPAKTAAAHEPAPAKEEATHEHPPEKEAVTHQPAPAKEAPHDHAPVNAPVKEIDAHEPEPAKEAAAHEIAPSKERAMHEAAPAQIEAAPKTAPAKVKAQPEEIIAKPIVTPKIVAKEEAVKIEKPAATGNWGVNLVAFKQEWFAKSKAAEFARQGIFAEVIPVYEKNTTMYRLRVGGFKTKAEAYSNTARIKKALNLSSVWVSEN